MNNDWWSCWSWIEYKKEIWFWIYNLKRVRIFSIALSQIAGNGSSLTSQTMIHLTRTYSISNSITVESILLIISSIWEKFLHSLGFEQLKPTSKLSQQLLRILLHVFLIIIIILLKMLVWESWSIVSKWNIWVILVTG